LTTLNDILAQYIIPPEELLFSSEEAEIRPHVTKLQSFAGVSAQQQAVVKGALAISDRRIFILAMGGLISKKAVMKFEAVYDPEFAKQYIEATKARNEDIKQRSEGVGVLSRGKFFQEEGYKDRIRIVTAASLQKGMLGGETLILDIFDVYTSAQGQRLNKVGLTLGRVFSWGTWKKMQYELRIKRPTSIFTKALAAPATAAGFPFFIPILKKYEGKRDTYGPFMDIMQAKAQGLAGLVKELEAAAVDSGEKKG